MLTAGPTLRTSTDAWDLTIGGELERARRWRWPEFRQLPREQITVDIHCVTRWSKLGTSWEGVSVDTLLDGVETTATHVAAPRDWRAGAPPGRMTRAERVQASI